MRLGGCRRAFVEVAAHFYWKTLVFQTEHIERYGDEKIPCEQTFELAERTCAARRITLDAGELVVGQTGGLPALRAVRCVDGADAVEFKIPIGQTACRLYKKLDTRVFAHRRLVLEIFGTQEIASYKKVDIQFFARMSHCESGQRMIGKFLYPVYRVYRASWSFFLK